jgi:hypothetical protein
MAGSISGPSEAAGACTADEWVYTPHLALFGGVLDEYPDEEKEEAERVEALRRGTQFALSDEDETEEYWMSPPPKPPKKVEKKKSNTTTESALAVEFNAESAPETCTAGGDKSSCSDNIAVDKSTGEVAVAEEEQDEESLCGEEGCTDEDLEAIGVRNFNGERHPKKRKTGEDEEDEEEDEDKPRDPMDAVVYDKTNETEADEQSQRAAKEWEFWELEKEKKSREKRASSNLCDHSTDRWLSKFCYFTHVQLINGTIQYYNPMHIKNEAFGRDGKNGRTHPDRVPKNIAGLNVSVVKRKYRPDEPRACTTWFNKTVYIFPLTPNVNQPIWLHLYNMARQWEQLMPAGSTNNYVFLANNKSTVEVGLFNEVAQLLSDRPIRFVSDIPDGACFRRLQIRDSNFGFTLYGSNQKRIPMPTRSITLKKYVQLLRNMWRQDAHIPRNPLLCVSKVEHPGIKNFEQLLTIAAERNLPTKVIEAERSSLEEQAESVRGCTMLLGTDDFLVNGIFMHEGTALIHIKTFRSNSRGEYMRDLAQIARLEYVDWINFELLDAHIQWERIEESERLRKAMKVVVATRQSLERNGLHYSPSQPAYDVIFEELWQLQATTVPPSALRRILSQALSSEAHRTLGTAKMAVQEVKFNPTADASITIMGSVPRVTLETVGEESIMYMRYNLTQIPIDGVTDAMLTLHVLESTHTGPKHMPQGGQESILQNVVWEAEDMAWTMNSLRKKQPNRVAEIRKFSVEAKRELTVDLTELVRKNAGKMMTIAVLGGKAVTTFCSSRFEDKQMRPKLQVGVLKKKGREARAATKQ